jgi:hypothetical protein
VGDEVVVGRVELERRRHVRREAKSEGFHDRDRLRFRCAWWV